MARAGVLGVLLILTTALICATAHAAVPACRVISQMMVPCVAFLSNRAQAPYESCCNGVTALNLTARTYEDRVGICSCIKGLMPRLPIVDFGRATALPRICGVDLNVTISPSTDCFSVPPP